MAVRKGDLYFKRPCKALFADNLLKVKRNVS